MNTKACSSCTEDRSLTTGFYKNARAKDGLQHECKICQKERTTRLHHTDDEYRRRNAERKKTPHGRAMQARRHRQQVQDLRRRVTEYLSEHPCKDCGEPDWETLQFDHVREKKRYSISVMVRAGMAWKTVQSEILKCEVRCANCHAVRTGKQRSWGKVPVDPIPSEVLRYSNWRRLNELKAKQGCVCCGEGDPRKLDFDHVQNKTTQVSLLVKKGWGEIMAEVVKCEVRCKNCHQRKHRQERR